MAQENLEEYLGIKRIKPKIYFKNKTREKPEVKRDYAGYDRSQTNEVSTWFKLISSLTEELPQSPIYQGKHGYDERDMLICCSIKQFFGFSYRRTLSLIKLMTGEINRLPCYKTIQNYMTKKEIQNQITQLIQMTSQKLKYLHDDEGIDLAVDSTGFSLNLASKWYGKRIGQFSTKKKEFRKLHIASDMLLNSITACIVSDAYTHDNKFFEKLLKESNKTHEFLRVFGDGAYCSRKNCEIVKWKYKAEPYLRPGKNFKSGGLNPFREVIRNSKTKKWQKTYVLRERIESVMSALKRLFTEKIKSRDKQGRVNEILLIALNYNITIMIKALFGYKFNIGLLHKRN